MKLKISLVILSILLVGGGISIFLQTGKSHKNDTEHFIRKWLTNENDTLATYIQRRTPIDEDLTAGREALAESLGLWMQYSLAKDDQVLFREAYRLLDDNFLDASGFIYWKLDESGSKNVVANALVDDLRIAHMLMNAHLKWNNLSYLKAAQNISLYSTKHNVRNQYLTDFYDKEIDLAGQYLTLSYVKTDALNIMKENRFITEEIYTKTTNVLINAPYQGPFLPKRFHIESEEYEYDEEINIVDQSIAAYYAQLEGKKTEDFYRFISGEMRENNKVYGKYHIDSLDAVVDYESPAIYGWLILYMIEYGDHALAKDIYERMTDFRKARGKYKGGYSVYDDDTHIFDNLLPLISEQELLNHKIVK
ncbi:glycosyl hydrolase family 8 [Jeotgalibacillus sp. JSM ZJ347]|uniref:glycosyl hydrolase family 8 n=1 Tax=Jeotgalibacillus sp. JSM ZJ347 TaxID=3342117 RepID=UPI0035A94675